GGDQRPQLAGGDRPKPDQHCREPAVVRLGEELLRVQREQRVLLVEIRHPDRQDLPGPGAWLLWRDALLPGPAEALLLVAVADREPESLRPWRGRRQRRCDAADVVLVGHRSPYLSAAAKTRATCSAFRSVPSAIW